MKGIRKAWGVAVIEFRSLEKDGRPPLILVFSLLMELLYTSDIFAYARQAKAAVTPWLLPLFLSDPNCRFILLGCAALLFCNMFRAESVIPYVVSRSGHQQYLTGKLAYVLLLSFAYTIYTAFAFAIFHLDQLYLASDWGGTLGSFARYGGPAAAGGITLILNTLSAGEAMWLSFLLLWLSFVNMAMIVFLFQISGRKTSSIAVLGILLLLEYLCTGGGLSFLPREQAKIAWFSPLSWSNMTMLSFKRYARPLPYPPVGYAVAVSIGISVLLLTISVIRIRLSDRPAARLADIEWNGI